MNIVVAMKQIPDLQQIRIRNRKPIFDDVPLTFGNIDKNALEAGMILKDSLGAKVILISAGNEDLEDTIKEALAVGADEAYLAVDDKFENLESSASARILAELIGKIEDTGLILFAEGSGDNYSGQVPSRVAAILEIPQVACASNIEIQGQKARITRIMEDAEEVLEVELPAVVSVLADINEPRIPSVSQILKAGKKAKKIFELDDLNIELTDPQMETLSNLAPEMERKCIKVETVEELLQALKAEGLIGR